MRFAALLLAVSPSFAFADTIIARSMPTEATVYTDGAILTRSTDIALPAGQHTVLLPDLFKDMSYFPIDIKLPGATIIASEWKLSNLGPVQHPETPELMAADTALTAAKQALQDHQDQITTAGLSGTAAQSQITFLKQLANSKTLPDGIDTLRDLSRMISEETLAATTAIQQSNIDVRTLSKDLKPLQDDVARAQLAYDALLPYSNQQPAQLSLTISVPSAQTSTLSMSHLTNARWEPTYDLRLDTSKDTPHLTVERGALVRQQSGLDWQGVDMTLSSLSLSTATQPQGPWSRLLRISDPVQLRKLSSQSVRMEMGSAADPIIEAPVIIQDESNAVYIPGIAASYSFAHKVDVNGRYEDVKLSLGTLEFDAEMTARAVPQGHDTAFRMVKFTNTSGERILPANQARLYVDGTIISETALEEIVAGGETEIGFGPIHGIRLTRTVLNRNEGDRGIISRSNEKTEDIRIDVENLTGDTWAVSLLDSVPHTEQEDLSITWSAAPRPTSENDEDRRGILRWALDMEPGEKQSISLKTKITWPDGMILR
jgi:uncharacterized protein (TIGR02231 family)